MTSRKRLIAAVVFLMLVGGIPRANSQNLDDAIDAELDSVDSNGSPSTASKDGVDDIQLDDGGTTAPKQTAKAPAPPAESKPATEDMAPSGDGGPTPGVVQDELSPDEMNLDSASDKGTATTESAPADVPLEAPAETEPSKTAETPKGTDDIDLDAPDGASQMPADNTAPSNDAPDIPLDDLNPPKAAPPGVPDAPQIATTADSIVIDNGNPAYEKKLSKYAKGYRQVPDVNWDEVVGDRREERYKLTSGDTLWDISETFFGDGFYWAKLWSQNGVIGNPHHVMRGKGIKFVAGTEADAPAIGVTDVTKSGSELTSINPLEQEAERPTYREQVQSEVTPEEIESGVVLETDELIPAPELPPPNRRAPILKTLPRSFPETHVEADADYDSTGFNSQPVIRARVAPSIYVNSFILDGSPNDIGKIEEIDTQEKVAADGQVVFVDMKKEMPMGSRITFVRRRERPSGAAGPVLEVQGVGIIDGVVKENANVYRATVTTTLAPIEKGALILEEAPPRVTVNQEGRHADAHVKIVGGEFDENRKQLGAPAIVYLNGGSSSGLAKGDILGISAKRGTRRDDTKFPNYTHSIAIIKIADVHEKVATAIVLHSTQPIMVGDMTSGDLPEDLPSIKVETADESASGFGHKDDIEIK